MLAASVLSPACAQEPSIQTNDLPPTSKSPVDQLSGEEKLHGKSVVVSWTERRMQRREGESSYRPTVRYGTFSVYVSAAGRVFNRFDMRNPKGGESGKRDIVGDGPRRHVSLSGNTMIAVLEAAAGGALRIVVTFDEAFFRCSADVIRGKEEGIDKMVIYSVIRPGIRIEITSLKTNELNASSKTPTFSRTGEGLRSQRKCRAGPL